MINKIKEEMETNIGKEVKIIFNGGRNRIEKFDATITEVYSSIFVVKLDNDINELKSFTFSDILTQTVEIYYK